MRIRCLVKQRVVMTTLPNLSGLRLLGNNQATATTLFEHVIEHRGNKEAGCTIHDEDWEEEPDRPGPRPGSMASDDEKAAWKLKYAKYRAYEARMDTLEDHRINCAIDGYLMYKEVSDGRVDPPPALDAVFDKSLNVTVGGKDYELKALPGRSTNPRRDRERRNAFEQENPDWVRDVFHEVCKRPGKLGSISWNGYGTELSGVTDWYYLDTDPARRGHLFLQLFDSKAMKEAKHMPTEGAFDGRYLYIAVVCAYPKTIAKDLLLVAEEASRQLGCTGVALATLSNSAGFYYSRNYRFMDKRDGSAIDTTAWTRPQIINGVEKTVLDPEMDVDVPEDQPSPAGRARSPPDADNTQERSRLKRPKPWYVTGLAGLSYLTE